MLKISWGIEVEVQYGCVFALLWVNPYPRGGAYFLDAPPGWPGDVDFRDIGHRGGRYFMFYRSDQ